MNSEHPSLFGQHGKAYVRRLPAPSVEQSSTSVARAIREDDEGTTSKRQKAILDALLKVGPNGATWKELGMRLTLHHGQASGALSTLHKAGLVFAVPTEARNGCQPYVHIAYRKNWADDQRADSPVTTKAGRKRQRLEGLAEAVGVFLMWQSDANYERMRDAYLLLESE